VQLAAEHARIRIDVPAGRIVFEARPRRAAQAMRRQPVAQQAVQAAPMSAAVPVNSRTA